MVNFIKKFLAEEDGASAPEYALLVALIAIVMAAVGGVLGSAISGVLQSATDTINGAAPAAGS